MKLHCHIAINVFHILKPHPLDEFSVKGTIENYIERGMMSIVGPALI